MLCSSCAPSSHGLISWRVQITNVASKLLLEQLGIIVDAADSGEEAMAIVERPGPISPVFDLLVIDVQLPGVSGYAFVSWYRERCKARQQPCGRLVALTAEPDEATCREFGFDACLPKPLSNACITELLQGLLPVRSPSHESSLSSDVAENGVIQANCVWRRVP